MQKTGYQSIKCKSKFKSAKKRFEKCPIRVTTLEQLPCMVGTGGKRCSGKKRSDISGLLQNPNWRYTNLSNKVGLSDLSPEGAAEDAYASFGS